jgi:hypothetical protein
MVWLVGSGSPRAGWPAAAARARPIACTGLGHRPGHEPARRCAPRPGSVIGAGGGSPTGMGCSSGGGSWTGTGSPGTGCPGGIGGGPGGAGMGTCACTPHSRRPCARPGGEDGIARLRGERSRAAAIEDSWFIGGRGRRVEESPTCAAELGKRRSRWPQQGDRLGAHRATRNILPRRIAVLPCRPPRTWIPGYLEPPPWPVPTPIPPTTSKPSWLN